MKRWKLVFAAVISLMLLPRGQGVQFQKLLPAELVYIERQKDQICVYTDFGGLGKGRTLSDALDDLRETASGEVFLDTVEYILLTEETRKEIPELRNHFRLSSAVMLATGSLEMEGLVQFLSAHRPEVSLKDYLTGMPRLPRIMSSEGRYDIEQNG